MKTHCRGWVCSQVQWRPQTLVWLESFSPLAAKNSFMFLLIQKENTDRALIPSLRIPTRKHFFRRQYWHWLRWCWSIWHSLFDLHKGKKKKFFLSIFIFVPTPSLSLSLTLLLMTPVMSELCELVWLKSYQGCDLCKSSALHTPVLLFTAGRGLPTFHRGPFSAPGRDKRAQKTLSIWS